MTHQCFCRIRAEVIASAILIVTSISAPTFAGDVVGRVFQVEGQALVITVESNEKPRPGETVEILVKIPDVGEGSIGFARIREVVGDIALAEIEGTPTGKISQGHLVRSTARSELSPPPSKKETEDRKPVVPSQSDESADSIGRVTKVTGSIVYVQVQPNVRLSKGDAVEFHSGQGPTGIGEVQMVFGKYASVTIERAMGEIAQGDAVKRGGAGLPAGAVPGSNALATPSQTAATLGNATWLGIFYSELTSRDASRAVLKDHTGVVVKGIHPDSPGSRSNLKVGDVVLAVNGSKTVDAAQFMYSMSKYQAGEEVTFDIARGKKRLRVSLTLIKYPGEEYVVAGVRRFADRGEAWAQYQLGLHHWSKAGPLTQKLMQSGQPAMVEYALRGGSPPDVANADDLAAARAWKRSYEEAERWLRLAADQADAPAQFTLAGIYMAKGHNAQARQLCLKSANQGYIPAELFLGNQHYLGAGVERDTYESRRWYEKAIAHGSTDALVYMGMLYLNGDGVPRDPPKGIRLVKDAAEEGNPFGQVMLAAAYETGNGVTRSRKQAIKWYSQAANQNQNPAVATQAQLSLTRLTTTNSGETPNNATPRSRFRRPAE